MHRTGAGPQQLKANLNTAILIGSALTENERDFLIKICRSINLSIEHTDILTTSREEWNAVGQDSYLKANQHIGAILSFNVGLSVCLLEKYQPVRMHTDTGGVILVEFDALWLIRNSSDLKKRLWSCCLEIYKPLQTCI